MAHPSVGRIVHYRSHGTPGGEYHPQCRAAIVTEIPDNSHDPNWHGETIGLAVLNPTGMFFNRTVPLDENAQRGGTWHWPERSETH